jgi:hypothetical protein
MKIFISLNFLLILSTVTAQFYLIVLEESFEFRNSTVRCSGAYFGQGDVVAPASCVDGVQPSRLMVKMTRPTPDEVLSNAQNARGYTLHPKYSSDDQTSNNIAVVTVWMSFFFNRSVFLTIFYLQISSMASPTQSSLLATSPQSR